MTEPSGPAFERFRAALALHESSGNPSAVQWHTKARGLFQFIPRWHAAWIKEETGRDLDSFLPKDSTPEEMARATQEQTEILFPKYYEKVLSPFIEKAKTSGLAGEYTDEELGAMAHFAGVGGAMEFLKTGADSTAGTVGNAAGGITEYLRQFNQDYSGDPVAKLAAASSTSKHYGEYGFGRGVYADYVSRDFTDQTPRIEKRKAARELGVGVSYSSSTESISSGPRPEVAGSNDVILNQDKDTLKGLTDLAQMLGVTADARGPDASNEEFMQRLRKEGRGF